MHRPIILCFVVVGLLAGGCGEKQEEVVAPKRPAKKKAAAEAETQGGTAPGAPPPGTPNAPAAAGTTSATPEEATAAIELLQVTVNSFQAELQKKPASLEEVMKKGFLPRMPASPEGKKYSYDPVKNEVTLVTRKPGELDPEPLSPEALRAAATESAKETHMIQVRAAMGVTMKVAKDEGDQVLAGLNVALTSFEAEMQRRPSSIGDLIKSAYLRELPPSPEGKKFAFDARKNQIVLVERKPDEKDPEPLTAEEYKAAAIKSAKEYHDAERRAAAGIEKVNPPSSGREELDENGKVLAAINVTLNSFEAEMQRHPASIAELITSGFMRGLPPSPEGKKFTYDSKKNQIVLADRKPDEKDPQSLTDEEYRAATIKSANETRERAKAAPKR